MSMIDELGSLPDRIAQAAERYRDLQEALAAAKKDRDRLIVQGIDHAGMTQAAVARAAGLTQPTITHVLATYTE